MSMFKKTTTFKKTKTVKSQQTTKQKEIQNEGSQTNIAVECLSVFLGKDMQCHFIIKQIIKNVPVTLSKFTPKYYL